VRFARPGILTATLLSGAALFAFGLGGIAAMNDRLELAAAASPVVKDTAVRHDCPRAEMNLREY
jgi:hypothetical protein